MQRNQTSGQRTYVNHEHHIVILSLKGVHKILLIQIRNQIQQQLNIVKNLIIRLNFTTINFIKIIIDHNNISDHTP